jgi:hypothetical protein
MIKVASRFTTAVEGHYQKGIKTTVFFSADMSSLVQNVALIKKGLRLTR